MKYLSSGCKLIALEENSVRSELYDVRPINPAINGFAGEQTSGIKFNSGKGWLYYTHTIFFNDYTPK